MGTPHFFDQSTVQEIIDVQYEISRPIIRGLLVYYLVTFYFPFIYEAYSHFVTRWALYAVCAST